VAEKYGTARCVCVHTRVCVRLVESYFFLSFLVIWLCDKNWKTCYIWTLCTTWILIVYTWLCVTQTCICLFHSFSCVSDSASRTVTHVTGVYCIEDKHWLITLGLLCAKETRSSQIICTELSESLGLLLLMTSNCL
jgi:hypothetical protein